MSRYDLMHILVTGGTGYIGSHTIIELLQRGHTVAAVDNLSNSSTESLKRVEQITGSRIPFYEVDCADKQALERVFEAERVDAVIHFAGLKALDVSVRQPLLYYRNNIDSTLVLCEVMQAHNVKRLVFSSSATVYGDPSELPLRETSRVGVGITNPYGQTKYMIEQILQDLAVADPTWQITILRYFNPVGAHQSGQIGEDPNGPPNNLLPFVTQTASGKQKEVRVFGDDYDTPDGTGIRDYIHVVDLAQGHVAALNHTPKPNKVDIYNLGTGKGTSVLEMIYFVEHAAGKTIPYVVAPRRAGDLATCYADASKAKKELGWQAQKSVEQACQDAWRWQSQNPLGFTTKATNKKLKISNL